MIAVAADSWGLEVRGYGDWSPAAVRVLRRHDSRHHRHPHQCAAHLRVRRSGQGRTNVPMGNWLIIRLKMVASQTPSNSIYWTRSAHSSQNSFSQNFKQKINQKNVVVVVVESSYPFPSFKLFITKNWKLILFAKSHTNVPHNLSLLFSLSLSF